MYGDVDPIQKEQPHLHDNIANIILRGSVQYMMQDRKYDLQTANANTKKYLYQ